MKSGRNTTADKISKIFFIFSILGFIYSLGFVTGYNRFFPAFYVDKALVYAKELISGQGDELSKKYVQTSLTETIEKYNPNAAYNGLSMITTPTKERVPTVRIIDMMGHVIHEWSLDWFKIWPDCEHLLKEEKPQAPPGTHIHGAVILESGDLVFNYERLGLVRVDVCGHIVWRLPYRTHHSIVLDENGFLWIPGLMDPSKSPIDSPYLDNIIAPSILKVSQDGEILQEISILDLLQKNDLAGLAVMSSLENWSTDVSGDILHLNDVEIFPRTKPPGIFEAGDILVSLRNINAIFVFSGKDFSIKYKNIGGFIRQHDPDFIDGNTISVFDNYNLGPEKRGFQSRILIESAATGASYTYFTGSKQDPFYTRIMGKHQWLPNGNLLITESMKGRAIEIDSNGDIVWQYNNIIEDGYLIFTEEVTRLAPQFTAEFFNEQIRGCSE